MKTFPLGDQAILFQFDQRIDPAVRAEVTRLQQRIQLADIPGVRYFIPAYCSLTVGYDPGVWTFEALEARIGALSAGEGDSEPELRNRFWRIPVCYEPPYAWDREDLCRQTGLDWPEIVALHTGAVYQVYMMGFLPGFAYLGILPEALACTRKAVPRASVPEGAVGLAGRQTGIYPLASPGGWQIAGQCPVPVFSPQNENPFLLQPGDGVQFFSISGEEYTEWKNLIQTGAFDSTLLYG